MRTTTFQSKRLGQDSCASFDIPPHAQILAVKCSRGLLEIHYLANPETKGVERTFAVLEQGATVPDSAHFVSSIDGLAFHFPLYVFELRDDS